MLAAGLIPANMVYYLAGDYIGAVIQPIANEMVP